MRALPPSAPVAASVLPEVAVLKEVPHSVVEEENTASAVRAFFRAVRAAVLASLRANRVPAAVSFVLGSILVVVYYAGGDATRPFFERLGELRVKGGLLFSVVTTSLSAGLLPSGMQVALGLLPRPYAANVAFNVVLWAFLGLVVDRLYAFQAWLFGDEADPATVVKKVLFDQFVWNPIVASPFLSLVLRWRDHGFPVRRCGEFVQPRAWALACCSILITTWGTWLPGTSVVYSFPTSLQMPAFNIILLTFSSLLSVVSQGATQASSGSSASSGPSAGAAEAAGPWQEKGSDVPEASDFPPPDIKHVLPTKQRRDPCLFSLCKFSWCQSL